MSVADIKLAASLGKLAISKIHKNQFLSVPVKLCENPLLMNEFFKAIRPHIPSVIQMSQMRTFLMHLLPHLSFENRLELTNCLRPRFPFYCSNKHVTRTIEDILMSFKTDSPAEKKKFEESIEKNMTRLLVEAKDNGYETIIFRRYVDAYSNSWNIINGIPQKIFLEQFKTSINFTMSISELIVKTSSTQFQHFYLILRNIEEIIRNRISCLFLEKTFAHFEKNHKRSLYKLLCENILRWIVVEDAAFLYYKIVKNDAKEYRTHLLSVFKTNFVQICTEIDKTFKTDDAYDKRSGFSKVLLYVAEKMNEEELDEIIMSLKGKFSDLSKERSFGNLLICFLMEKAKGKSAELIIEELMNDKVIRKMDFKVVKHLIKLENCDVEKLFSKKLLEDAEIRKLMERMRDLTLHMYKNRYN